MQKESAALPGFGKAESVIFVYLQGAPSHIDLWDPKPKAPAEIRGEFAPIATAAGDVCGRGAAAVKRGKPASFR